MDQILDKLDKILEAKFPDKKIREEIIVNSGEIVLWETINEALTRLSSERERDQLSELIKFDNILDAFDFAEKRGVKIQDIFEDKAKKLVLDIFE